MHILRERLEIVHNSGMLLLNMITDLLEMSMLGKGKLRLHFEEINLKKVIKDYFKLLSLQASSKGIKLILKDEIKYEEGKTIRSDGNRLRQVLTNLIGKAIKFTFEGSITVRISEPKS